MQCWIVSYDISCPNRRIHVAQCLLDHGERVQESVYELRLRTGQWQQLSRELLHLIDPLTDQWRAWPLCANDRADAVEFGVASTHPVDKAVVV